MRGGCRRETLHEMRKRLPERFGRKSKALLHGARIEDYALIGDLETSALVSREGSIDWLCWPNFSSAACFAALLGTADNGFWQIRPKGALLESSRSYRKNSLILETRFVTDHGEVLLTDFMPPRGKNSDVIRIVRGIRGKVTMSLSLVLRFDYGLTVPWVTKADHEMRAIAGPNMTVLRTFCVRKGFVVFHGEDLKTRGEFTLAEGDEVCFTLTYANSNEDVPEPVDVAAELQQTESFWTDWSRQSKYTGPYQEAVQRSLLTLKALTYGPTGGIVAAPTTSLPERVGGERNWDYRYCWLRDTAFTLLILMIAGYTEEAIRWRLWLLRAIAGSPDQMQSLYGICGERRLQEWTVAWLFQLDVFGEVAAALNRTPEIDDDVRTPASDLQAALIDHLCQVWPLPDEGIWETRGGRKQFVHSKVMAWVALHRAVKYHERFDGSGDVKRWRKNARRLRKDILTKGFNKKLKAFTQSYGSDTLDASLLRMVLAGFLPATDPRMVSTIEAIQKRLTRNGLVERYDPSKAPDGLKGSEGTFLACSFWLVICLKLMGRTEEATQMFERLLALRNDVGLLSEEYDAKSQRMLGNFPQALSHLALVHAAFTLSDQWKPEPAPAD